MSLRRAIYATREFIVDIPWRVRNIRRFFSAVWYFNACDWSPSFELLRRALLANAEVFEHGHLVDHQHRARECRIAAELLRRLIDEDVEDGLFEYKHRVYSSRMRRAIPLGRVRGDEYSKMLGHLIGRKMRMWWD